jgi:hypothetical protein
MTDLVDPTPHVTAAKRGILSLYEALERTTENEYSDVSQPYTPQPPKFWPSTIPHIDTICGGFYGVSVVTGQPGTGKTLLSIASAIEAAASREIQPISFRPSLREGLHWQPPLPRYRKGSGCSLAYPYHSPLYRHIYRRSDSDRHRLDQFDSKPKSWVVSGFVERYRTLGNVLTAVIYWRRFVFDHCRDK